MSTKQSTRHPLTISYTLIVTDEVIDYIKGSDGCRYWVADEEGIIDENADGDATVTFGGETYTFNTETVLRGIALWVQNGGDWDSLKECYTDHTDHDAIWQYGFFNELVYG
jgi:hypothetical protein